MKRIWLIAAVSVLALGLVALPAGAAKKGSDGTITLKFGTGVPAGSMSGQQVGSSTSL